MRQKISLTCSQCGCIFERDLSRYNYGLTKGWNGTFCSRSCRTKSVNPIQYWEKYGNRKKRIKRSKNDYRADKFTPIRSAYKNAVGRAKKAGLEILTIDEALEIFNAQNGKCIYTGLSIDGSYLTQSKKDRRLYMASIDRIDSAKGYTIDNIQFVCQMANFAKNELSHSDMVEFCKAIAIHWSDR